MTNTHDGYVIGFIPAKQRGVRRSDKLLIPRQLGKDGCDWYSVFHRYYTAIQQSIKPDPEASLWWTGSQSRPIFKRIPIGKTEMYRVSFKVFCLKHVFKFLQDLSIREKRNNEPTVF